jgi:hypothetical protein
MEETFHAICAQNNHHYCESEEEVLNRSEKHITKEISGLTQYITKDQSVENLNIRIGK